MNIGGGHAPFGRDDIGRAPGLRQSILNNGRAQLAGPVLLLASPRAGDSLEGWRDLLTRSADIVSREKPIFRAGVRFGIISVNATPVVFHFEREAASRAAQQPTQEG